MCITQRISLFPSAARGSARSSSTAVWLLVISHLEYRCRERAVYRCWRIGELNMIPSSTDGTNDMGSAAAVARKNSREVIFNCTKTGFNYVSRRNSQQQRRMHVQGKIFFTKDRFSSLWKLCVWVSLLTDREMT